MKFTLFLRTLISLLCLEAVDAQCNPESFIPNVPSVFTARYRVLRWLENTAVHSASLAEETYDIMSGLVAVKMEQIGGFKHIVDNYISGQEMVFTNNSQCSVNVIPEATESCLLGYDMETFSVGKLLRAMEQSSFTKAEFRPGPDIDGIPTCKLNVTLPDDQDLLELKLDVYFAANNWNFTHDLGDVFKRPLMLQIRGIILDGTSRLEFTNTYILFEMQDTINEESFQIPPGVSCQDIEKPTKPVWFPLSEFSVDVEMYRYIKGTDNQPDKRLIEIAADGRGKVHRQQEQVVNADTFLPDFLTYITDGGTNMLYIIDKGTGSCLDALDMADPKFVDPRYSYPMINEVLFNSENMTKALYVGKRGCRKGRCNVYSVSVDNETLEVYVPDVPSGPEFGIPIMTTVTQLDDQKQLVVESATHYFNFQREIPDWSLFDTSACYNDEHLLRFQVTLKGQINELGTANLLDALQRDFVSSVSSVVPDEKVPLTRINQIRIDSIYDDYIVVAATLIEDPANAGLRKSPKLKIKLAPTNRDILDVLSTEVFARNFSVEVLKTDANTTQLIKLTGEDVTDDILSGNEDKFLNPVLNKFTEIKNSAIDIVDAVMSVADISIDRCASMCKTDNSYSCKTFVFCPATGGCKLYVEHVDFIDAKFIVHSGDCSIYESKFEDDFTKMNDVKMIGYTLNVSKIDLVTECYSYCDKLSEGIYSHTCESFDICKAKPSRSVCTIHTQSADLVPVGALKRDPTCELYSRIYLDLFLMMNNVRYDRTGWVVSEISGISEEACASNCLLDPAGCSDFEMCSDLPDQGRFYCYLMSSSSGAYAPLRDERCAHYALKNAKPTGQVTPPITDSTDDATASSFTPTTEESTTRDVKVEYDIVEEHGYSSGEMAGLGIAMIILGACLGFGVVWIIAKRNASRDPQERNILLQMIGTSSS